MHHLVGEIRTEDGVRLYSQTWLPTGEPRAMLAFSHGAAEHTDRYAHVGEALTDAGYGLHMADLRGHGNSEGKRGHVMSFADYREDFAAIVQSAWDVAPEAPYFIGGHSLGGLIALNAALDRPLGARGVAVSSPVLKLNFEPPGWKVLMGSIMSFILPGLSVSNELDPTGLSRDEAVVQAYRDDPRIFTTITARGYTEMMTAQQETMANAARLEMPLLIMHGAADPIASPAASQEFYERASSADKTYKPYEGMYHEIFNEIGNEQVLADLIAWMDAHI